MSAPDNDLVQIGGFKGRETVATPPDDARRSDPLTDATRRRFLEVMGASIALAAGTGCTRPNTEFLMPYVEPPEQAVPGRPKYFATATVVNGVAEGVIAETHLGRPTKVEGNPRHPASLGATTVLSQAAVLDLYDPDRAKQVMYRSQPDSWEKFVAEFSRALAPVRNNQGRGLSILSETVISPTLGAQLTRVLQEMPEAKWHQYDPAGPHTAREGAQLAFGQPVHTRYNLEKAQVILALDANLLAEGSGSTRYSHDYALGRRVRGANAAMNRLYAVESTMTATGGKADNRLQLRYSEMSRFAAEMASALGVGGAAPAMARNGDWIGPVARDLLANRGKSVVIVGENQPAVVHALGHAMNAALGNVGNTVIYSEPLELRSENQVTSLAGLVADMNAGNVKVLAIIGGNPAYNAPADIDFAGALSHTPFSVHLSMYADETSRRTEWHVPQKHYFEHWSDARAYDGTVTVLQPLIEPLYQSAAPIEFLDLLFQIPARTSMDIVRSYWKTNSGANDFEAWWRQSVGQGLVADSGLKPLTPALRSIDTAHLLSTQAAAGLDLVFRTDPYIYDGRYANNAWLQELPRPVTKLTWDNAVHINPRTAASIGVNAQDMVRLNYKGRGVEGSVWISPGEADDTVTVHLGYGRKDAGVVGDGAGFDAYRLRTSDSLWFGSGVKVQPVGRTYPLATTQMFKSLNGRDVLTSAPVDTYRKNPDFVHESHTEPLPEESLYPQWSYTGYNWGMAIDLTACVNCNACVIACQAENNIPVVGKEQVLARREMHWLRIDAYYSGAPGRTTMRYEPIPCMHCENAPCEVVCPVQATIHSADGLNDMVYNRCVGTRFCSNNCPYKVRRFNWLLYADWYTEQLKLQRNPDVSVRSRGVMEKCTYCVQRIREAEIRAQDEDRYIRDGEILTACQQACPTRAIVFGDMNNKGTEVSRMKAEKLNYSMLGELNTRPHTTYLAELRNPNPELPA